MSFAATPQERAWSDIACVVAASASSCEEGLRAEPSVSRMAVLGQVGCQQLKSATACAQWAADLLHVKDTTGALERYQTSCDLGLGDSCLNVLSLNRAQAENKTAAELQELLIRMRPVAQKACQTAAKYPSLCKRAQDITQELGRRQDGAYGPCRLKYSWFDRRTYRRYQAEVADGEGLSQIGTKEQCPKRCAERIAGLRQPENSLGFLRGECEFAGEDLPPAFWGPKRPVFCTMRQSLMVGNGAEPLYARCFCETAPQQRYQALADKFGIFVVGVSAYSKIFGASKWSRCGRRYYFDDEAAARKDPEQCKQNLKAFRNEIKTLPPDAAFVNDFGNLNCGNR